MKTIFLITSLVFFMLFTSVLSFAEARGFSPFSFHLVDEIMYNDLWFYVDGSKSNFKVDKGETATFPLSITSKAFDGTVVDFHATIDNDQMGEIRFPPGVNIQLEPNQMTMNGTNQILNVTVHVSEKAPSSKYNVQLVGVWKDEGKIPNFMGTAFSLHVGRDFGNDAIPVNFFMSPLKFAKDGVPPEEILCRNGFILILKYDDSPACVHEDTKPKLIQRGWMKTQVDVFNDTEFIESSKNLDSVQLFLSMHPNARINVDHENFSVIFEESGFKEHRIGITIHHTKKLVVNLDYDGMPRAYSLVCSVPAVSLQTNNIELLENTDWCFPLDQSEFDSSDNTSHDISEKRIPVDVPDATSENDMYCETNWNVITTNELNPVHIKQSVQSTIAQFGMTYFLEERIIDVSENSSGYVVSVSGAWDRKSIQYMMITEDLENFGEVQGEPISCQ